MRHLILKIEDLVEGAVEPVGPKMSTIEGIDQLRSDADAAASPAHRPFENIAHAELAPDLLHIHVLTFVGKTRIAGDDKQPADAAECHNDFLYHPVGEVFVLSIAADIGERQH